MDKTVTSTAWIYKIWFQKKSILYVSGFCKYNKSYKILGFTIWGLGEGFQQTYKTFLEAAGLSASKLWLVHNAEHVLIV